MRSHVGGADRLRARFMTAGEGEFLGLSRAEAARRIADGRELARRRDRRPIDGLRRAGLALRRGRAGGAARRWRSRLPRIICASGRRRPASNSPAGRSSPGRAGRGCASPRRSLAAAALRHAPLEVLRIGVHPPDVRHPALVRSIDKTFARAAATERPPRCGTLSADLAQACGISGGATSNIRAPHRPRAAWRNRNPGPTRSRASPASSQARPSRCLRRSSTCRAPRRGSAPRGRSRRVGIDHHSRNEALVDLEHVDRQALEIGEARIAGAEIVHRDGRVERLQRIEHARCARRVLDDRAFGQLEASAGRR